jgi:hypothetical protein
MWKWLEHLTGKGKDAPAPEQSVPRLPRAFGDAQPEIVHGSIVIPDISGYTALVSAVELVHAQEVVTRLMGAIVGDGWELMQVSKLLGDAVLMYAPVQERSGAAFQADTLSRIERIYRAFAQERKTTFDDRRICPCAGCQQVPQLELKFIVHYGEFMIHQIDSFRELLGREVIQAFRLLKNHVARHRYILMTEAFLALDRSIEGKLLETGEETYDHLGAVRVGILDPLAP